MLTWKRRQSWVAVFDILGFGRFIEEAEREFPRALLTNRLDELLTSLGSEEQRQGSLDYLVFSDTIVIFAPSQEPSGYPGFLLQCEIPDQGLDPNSGAASWGHQRRHYILGSGTSNNYWSPICRSVQVLRRPGLDWASPRSRGNSRSEGCWD